MNYADLLTTNQTGSFSEAATVTEGTIPSDLRGTLMRNGPGTLELDGYRLHYFDGHSLVATLTFGDDGAHFRCTQPGTPLREAETRAGRMTQRRFFTNLPGWLSNVFKLKFGNPASHDIVMLGDRILATDIGGHFGVDATTLADRGEFDWGKSVPPGHMVSAMPRDLGDHFVIFTVKQGGAANDKVTFKELDADLAVVAEAQMEVEGFVHDLSSTPNWFIGIDNPLAPSVFNLLSGRTTAWRAFSPKGPAPVVKLCARDGSHTVVSVPLEAPIRTVFHHINAFEDGDDVILDCIGYPMHVRFDYITPPSMRGGEPVDKGNPGRLLRLRIDPRKGTLRQETLVDAMGDAPEVDPVLHGRPYRHAWLAGTPTPNDDDPNFFFWSNTVLHIDTQEGSSESWSAEGYLLSPPAFAPRIDADGPEDGYVLTWMLALDSGETEVAIFDATNIAQGPVARLAVGPYLPPASHCRFSPLRP